MKSIDKRIQELEELVKQAKEKKRQIEAKQKAIAAKKKRSEETRRKILVGAVILTKIESGEWPKDRFLAMMDSALSKTYDRALFGLKAREEKPKILAAKN